MGKESMYAAIVLFNRYFTRHAIMGKPGEPTRSDLVFGCLLLAMKSEDFLSAVPEVFKALIRLYQRYVMRLTVDPKAEVSWRDRSRAESRPRPGSLLGPSLFTWRACPHQAYSWYDNYATAGCLSFHPMAQCVVHALKGLARRARVTPASSPVTLSLVAGRM